MKLGFVFASLLTCAFADNLNKNDTSTTMSPLELAITISISVIITGMLLMWLAYTILKKCRKDAKKLRVKKVAPWVFPIKQGRSIVLKDSYDQQI
jgi:biotin transporter BioY